MGPYSGKETGEHALLRQILTVFNEGDIVLGDRYYPSFFLMSTLMMMGIDAVFPMHTARSVDFRRGKRLGKKDHLMQWCKPQKPSWMSQEDYDKFPDNITVREIAIDIEQKGYRANNRVLVTTFLNSQEVTKDDLATLYDCRWFVEICLKSIKETMQMDKLRTKTPEMVRKEVWAHLLAYNLIRKIMAQAGKRYGRNPRTLSFKLAMQFIFVWRQKIDFISTEYAYKKLLEAIAHKKVGNRPGRNEPRRVKRRPKAFPRLQKPRNFYHKNKDLKNVAA